MLFFILQDNVTRHFVIMCHLLDDSSIIQLCSPPEGKSVTLQRAIAVAVKAQLAVPWLPSDYRMLLHGETQVNL